MGLTGYTKIFELLKQFGSQLGDIPVRFTAGWIDVESSGDIRSTGRYKDKTTGEIKESKLQEYGYFQISLAEDSNQENHARLREDPQANFDEWFKLVAKYRHAVESMGVTLDGDAELYWKLVKLYHQVGSGASHSLLSGYSDDFDGAPTSWASFRQYASENPYKDSEYTDRGLAGVDKLWSRGVLYVVGETLLAPVLVAAAGIVGDTAVDWAGIIVALALLGAMGYVIFRRN